MSFTACARHATCGAVHRVLSSRMARFALISGATLVALVMMTSVALSLSHSRGGATLLSQWGLHHILPAVRASSSEPMNLTCCSPRSAWRCVSDYHNASWRSDVPPLRRIGFVTSASGPRENDLVSGLWRSLTELAFLEHDVHMYVFTDLPERYETAVQHGRLHTRHAIAMVPPFDVLGRHALYVANFDWFRDLDYVFSIDVHVVVTALLDDAALGERVASISACDVDAEAAAAAVRPPRTGAAYDRRTAFDGTPYSAAYVGEGEGGCYFAGELFGGTRRGFRGVLDHSVQLMRTDVTGTPPRVAELLDESYLNRVFIDFPPTVVLARTYSLNDVHDPDAALLRGPPDGGEQQRWRCAMLARKRHGLPVDYRPHAVPVPRSLLPSSSAARVLQLPFVRAHRTPAVTFLVRAFERPRCLKELLASIHVRYPGAAVVVLDDSKRALLTADDVAAFRDGGNRMNLTYIRAEHDIGLSAAHRHLISVVETTYAVMLLDTMLLDSASDVQHLASMLETTGGDAVGACVEPPPLGYGGYRLRSAGGVLLQTGEVGCSPALTWSPTANFSRRPDYTTPAVACWSVDLPLEFYVARVSTLRRLQWDPSVGPRGHEDLFLRAKAERARVSMCQGVNARWNRACDEGAGGTPTSPAATATAEGPPPASVRDVDDWAGFMHKWQLNEVQTPVASIVLRCGAASSGGTTTCATDASGPPAAAPLASPGSTDGQCCGDASPWVCATGGALAGNLSAATPWSRYTNLRIGFVTYATGPYNEFVRGLWASIQEHAFTRHDVHLFLFTNDAASFSGLQNVHARHTDRVGWPFDSIGRHFLYLADMDWFAESDVDYIFSIDSDLLVVGTLDESMLGERVAALNAWFFGRPRHAYTYDARRSLANTKLSSAYIGGSEGQCYFAGGVFGGSLVGFRDILERTVRLARRDLGAHPPRVALWHDESYLNRVFIDVPPTVVLGPNFVYPEPPVDSWLYAQAPPASTAWSVPPGRSRRFSPRVLILGARKHVDRTLSMYQPPPLHDAIPATMTLSGVPGTLLRPLDRGQRLADITFLVKAFERPHCVRRLLASLGDVYPGANVIVLDDSRVALLSEAEAAGLAQQHSLNLTYVATEHDIGVSAGRNRLIELVSTPYAVLLDEDSVLNGAENVLHLLAVLELGGFDFAGGCVENPVYGVGWSYSLKLDGDRLTLQADVSCAPGVTARRPPDFETADVACWKADFILNFFVVRADALRGPDVRWDPRLKTGDHEDFFLRVQRGGLTVAMCRGVTVMNDNSCDKNVAYTSGRQRVFKYWVLFFDTWGLREMQTSAGLYRLKCEAEGCVVAVIPDAPGTLALPNVAAAEQRGLAEITFLVKAFERPHCVRRLLASLGDVYPGANVIVLDDSRVALLSEAEAAGLAQQHSLNLTYVATEHDIGVSAGRNRLIELVSTPYAVLLDEDSVLNGAENVLHLLAVLELGGFDFAGGCVQSVASGVGWSHSLHRKDDRLTLQADVSCAPGVTARRPPDFETPDVACWKADLINNFFVARVVALRGSGLRWDPRLRVNENEDFFLRAQRGGLAVAMCRGVTAIRDDSCGAAATAAVVPAVSVAPAYSVLFYETWALREVHTAAGLYRLMCKEAGQQQPTSKDFVPWPVAPLHDGVSCEIELVMGDTSAAAVGPNVAAAGGGLRLGWSSPVD